MPVKKFTKDYKDYLRGKFATKLISLSESGTAVKARCLEKFKDAS